MKTSMIEHICLYWAVFLQAGWSPGSGVWYWYWIESLWHHNCRVVFCQKEKRGTMYWNACYWVLFCICTCVHRQREKGLFYMKQAEIDNQEFALQYFTQVQIPCTQQLYLQETWLCFWLLCLFEVALLCTPDSPPLHGGGGGGGGVISVQVVLAMKGIADMHGVCRESISFWHNIVQTLWWDANEKLLRTLWCLYPSVADPASGPSYSFINHLESWWWKCTQNLQDLQHLRILWDSYLDDKIRHIISFGLLSINSGCPVLLTKFVLVFMSLSTSRATKITALALQLSYVVFLAV